MEGREDRSIYTQYLLIADDQPVVALVCFACSLSSLLSLHPPLFGQIEVSGQEWRMRFAVVA